MLFDKGDKILKSVEFHKSTAQWIYQLQNAQDVPDRADAAQALAGIKGDDAVVAALGEAALHDAFWGVRNESLLALGRIGGSEAEQRVLAATVNPEPWVRETAVSQLGHFRDDPALAAKLAEMFRHDAAYRVRSAALLAYGQLKPADGLAFLQDAARIDSPDDVIRRAALRAMGALGDDMAVATLEAWSAQGKPIDVRDAAISSLAELDKKNGAIESQLLALSRRSGVRHSPLRLFALGTRRSRGDRAARSHAQSRDLRWAWRPTSSARFRGSGMMARHERSRRPPAAESTRRYAARTLAGWLSPQCGNGLDYSAAIPRAECAGRAGCCRWGRFRWRLRVGERNCRSPSGARSRGDRDCAARARSSVCAVGDRACRGA